MQSAANVDSKLKSIDDETKLTDVKELGIYDILYLLFDRYNRDFYNKN